MKVLENWNQTEPMDAILLLPNCDYNGVNCLVRRCTLWLVDLTVSDVVGLPLMWHFSELGLIIDNDLMIVKFWIPVSCLTIKIFK